MSDARTELEDLARRLGEVLQARGLMLATAESCTGGWAAMAVTAISGSSKWFERGYVTYSNRAKQEVLGVEPETLATHGAVSEPVVREMAEGAIRASHAQVSLAVSGVAGPEGGTPTKPVGSVCLAWSLRDGETRSRKVHCDGDRQAVRHRAVVLALAGVMELLQGGPGDPREG